ncbi:hypothetical protein FHT44_005009 [Mycolicibacterium sp. BK634]|uniref:hypothetical protein n=1 Tax=Mycolicibacterium sp. BK634 TaxID=2587099 RepID=UPI001619B43D|nr:hypothetical protein [Mycolicibacterium sp. BK634]MBB3752497.1 hypothetical protein [Mycolicibacterium sp. BK634]
MPSEYIGFAPQEHGSAKVAWGRDCGTIQMTVAGPIGWREDLIGRPCSCDGRNTACEAFGCRSSLETDNSLDWHFTFHHRREINDLIELLRKARDGAFGKDA